MSLIYNLVNKRMRKCNVCGKDILVSKEESECSIITCSGKCHDKFVRLNLIN